MSDEQPTAAPAVEDQAPAVPESTSEATNGVETNASAAETSDPPAAEAAEPKITAEDVAAAGPQATTSVNPPDGGDRTEADVGAAAADASSSGKGKRKSGAGVPEHKTKKLNKKKSAGNLNLNLDVEPGDFYWARLKGYPPWPAVCCDEDMLPATLLGTRPVSTKSAQGTYREDFLDGGKNVRDRTYPMMFLATNEFAWMLNSALKKLDPSECTYTDSDKKLSKDLRAAYDVAREQHSLDFFKEMLQQHDQEMKDFAAEQQRQDDEKAEKEAKKAEKAAEKTEKEAKKKSRKSKGGEGDDMEVDTEEKPSKKRKKEVESEGEGGKKKPKVKLSAKEGKETGTASAKKPKPKKVVSKPEDESVDETAEAPLTEVEKQARREKAVLYLRHRLQKGFLSRDTPPKEEEMAGMAEFFTQLESYADLEPATIRVTKIHKVLRAIVKLESIPKEEEHQFKKRSSVLLSAWNNALDGAPETKATTNGEAKTTTEAKTEDKEDTKEPSAAPVEATELGNGAVDEGDATAADLTMADASTVETKEDKPAEDAIDAVDVGAGEAPKLGEVAEDAPSATA